MIRLFLNSLMHLMYLLMLAACATPTEVMALSGPDSKSLTYSSIDLSGRILHLPLPSEGLSKDWPHISIVSKLELSKLPPGKLVMLVNQMWDWRGPFWQGVNGSIVVRIAVQPAPKDVNLSCASSLRKMIESKIEQERREFIKLGGQDQYMSHYIIEQQIKKWPGASALVYGETGHSNSNYYVFPLSEQLYVSIGIETVSGQDNEKFSQWRNEATKVKEAIINGMRFEGPWPQLKSINCAD